MDEARGDYHLPQRPRNAPRPVEADARCLDWLTSFRIGGPKMDEAPATISPLPSHVIAVLAHQRAVKAVKR